MIIRVFRARVHPGKVDAFRRFFEETALPLVRSQGGLIQVEVGWPMPPTPDEFLMIMKWESVAAIRAFAGDDWRMARILPEERHLLLETSVHHYEAAGV